MLIFSLFKCENTPILLCKRIIDCKYTSILGKLFSRWLSVDYHVFFRCLHLFLFSKAMLSPSKSYVLGFRKLFFYVLKVMLLLPESIAFRFLARNFRLSIAHKWLICYLDFAKCVFVFSVFKQKPMLNQLSVFNIRYTRWTVR